MDSLTKSIEVQQLYDLYQSLLTAKQREYFEEYYFEDFSITEISENKNVSRNAVHDLIKRTVSKLYDYENKLGLLKQGTKRGELLVKLLEVNHDEQVEKLLEELQKVE